MYRSIENITELQHHANSSRGMLLCFRKGPVFFLIIVFLFFSNSKISAQSIGTTTTVSGTNNPFCLGSNLTLTATITPAAATGTVQFYDGPSVLGSPVNISGGVATYSTTSLSSGSHSITAIYSGDVNYAGSVSAPYTQTINSYPALVAGSHNTNAVTACSNYNPDVLNFNPPNTPPSGGLAPYSYQWQESIDGGAWTDIAGATLSSYDPSNLVTPGTYSYRVVIRDVCDQTATTASKTITIVSDPSVTISGGTSFCVNAATTLTATVTNGTGTIGYQWQSGTSQHRLHYYRPNH